MPSRFGSFSCLYTVPSPRPEADSALLQHLAACNVAKQGTGVFLPVQVCQVHAYATTAGGVHKLCHNPQRRGIPVTLLHLQVAMRVVCTVDCSARLA